MSYWLHALKPGNANLLIGGLSHAIQENGVPRRHQPLSQALAEALRQLVATRDVSGLRLEKASVQTSYFH